MATNNGIIPVSGTNWDREKRDSVSSVDKFKREKRKVSLVTLDLLGDDRLESRSKLGHRQPIRLLCPTLGDLIVFPASKAGTASYQI